MRHQWACPDLGEVKDEGIYLPVDGTDQQFPECPAAYLRMPHDIPDMEERFGRPPFAEHLIDGGEHPAVSVSMYANEIESGARLAASLSPRVLMLVHLYMRERAKARAYESDMRRRH